MQNQTTHLDHAHKLNSVEVLDSIRSNFFTTAYDSSAIKSERDSRLAKPHGGDSLPSLTLFDLDTGFAYRGPACKPDRCDKPTSVHPDVNPNYRPRNPYEPGSPMFWKRELATAADPKDRVRAAAHLGDGPASMMVTVDESVALKVDVEPVDPKNDDGRSYVTIYAYDETEKKYYVAFRGIYDEKTDTVSHQVDKNGNEVPYTTEEFQEKYEGKYPLLPEKLNSGH